MQRWVTRRATMVLTDTQSLTIDFRSRSAGARRPTTAAPPSGPTSTAGWPTRPIDAGAVLIASTTATGLRARRATVASCGVRTDRPDGDIEAPIVIACDGVNSFLAKEAGLYHHPEPEHFTLGVKEVLALPREVIDDRFGLIG